MESSRLARHNLSDYAKNGAVGLLPGTRRLAVGQDLLTARQRGRLIEIVAIRHARQGDVYPPTEAKR